MCIEFTLVSISHLIEKINKIKNYLLKIFFSKSIITNYYFVCPQKDV